MKGEKSDISLNIESKDFLSDSKRNKSPTSGVEVPINKSIKSDVRKQFVKPPLK